MFAGCYTTEKIYKDIETNTVLTLFNIAIVSHQNNMGVLFYTLAGQYTDQNFITAKSENPVILKEIEDSFPLATYADAVFYRDNNPNRFPKEITNTEKKKEFVREEKVFSRGKTAMAVLMPIAGVLTILLTLMAARTEITQ